jgi:ABC-type spermidine/putrescine transport system permease subunit II
MRTLAVLALALPLIAGPALAQDSAANGSAAGGASSEAAAHLTASGVQTALAVSVVPASVAGTVSMVGGVSAAGSGIEVSRAAGNSAAVASGPLKVDNRVVVAPDPAPHVPYNAEKPHG